jgi:hypothetical protein
MRTDGLTDMKKLTLAFRNFENAPKKNLKDMQQTAIRKQPLQKSVSVAFSSRGN